MIALLDRSAGQGWRRCALVVLDDPTDATAERVMCGPRLDNGEWMMRAQREAQQQARNQYLSALYGSALNQANPYLTPRAWSNAQSGGPTPGEREAEDVTGLRMLEEFLAKRKGERNGNERK
jgi:hypothetical protein